MIESGAAPDGPAATIKLHHNVGGLPEELGFELIEPLRDLFKDEVRKAGPGTGPAGGHRLAAPVPRSRPGRPLPGRSDPGTPGHPPRSGRDRGQRDQGGRPVSRDFPGVRRAAARPKRRRDGRRSNLRKRRRDSVRQHGRLHDGRLEPTCPTKFWLASPRGSSTRCRESTASATTSAPNRPPPSNGNDGRLEDEGLGSPTEFVQRKKRCQEPSGGEGSWHPCWLESGRGERPDSRGARRLSPIPECGASMRGARIRSWRAVGKQMKYAGSCRSSRLTLT